MDNPRLLAILVALVVITTTVGAIFYEAPDEEDTTPPTIAVEGFQQGEEVSGEVLIEVKARDNEGITQIRFAVDQEEVQSGRSKTYLWDTTTYSNGPHKLTVRASDAAGNLAQTSHLFMVANNQAPELSLSYSMPIGPYTELFMVRGNAEDEEGTLTSLQYALCDTCWQTAWEDASGVGSISWELPFDPAIYTVGPQNLEIRVFDGELFSETITIPLEFNHRPVAVIDSPQEEALFQLGEEVTLDGSGSTDNEPLNYRWYTDPIGQLYHGLESTFNYFPEAGDHAVSLEVSDGKGGHDSAFVSFTVNAPPEVEVWTPAPDTLLSGEVNLVGQARDPDDQTEVIELRIDQEDWHPVTVSHPWEYLWDTVSVEDGTHQLTVRATDQYDGTTTIDPVSYLVDNTPPEVDWVSPQHEGHLEGWTEVSVTASDTTTEVVSYSFYCDGMLMATGPTDNLLWNTSTAEDGTHDLTVDVTDLAGNTFELGPLEVMVDNQPPYLAWLSPTTEYLSQQVDFELEVTEEGGEIDYVAFHLEGEEVQNSTATSWQWDTTEHSDGSDILVEVWVCDEAGHTSNLNMTVMVDNTAPQMSVKQPEAGTNMTGVITVEAGAVEKGSGMSQYQFYLDDELVKSGSSYLWDWDTSTAEEGEHTLKVQGQDKAGNTNVTQILVYLDHTPPEVSDLTPAEGSDLDGQYTATLTATDALSGMDNVEFYLDSQLKLTDESAPYQWTFDTDDFSEGNHTLEVWAYDKAGNRAQLSARYFFGEQEQAVVTDPGTNFLSRYDVSSVERITLDSGDWAAIPYLAGLVPNFGVTPSLGWDGTQNPKETLELDPSNIGKFSGEIALSYYQNQNPERAIVVDSYEKALILGPLAGLANIPLLLYDATFTDEALYKLGTVYAPQILVCGNTPYETQGVTVLTEEEVLAFTLDYAVFIDHEVDYLVATNPNDGSVATTPRLSSHASAWATHYGGVLISVPANANQMDTLIHNAYTEFEDHGLTPRFLNIVGDEKSTPQMNIGGTPSDNKYADRDGDRYTVEVANGRLLDKSLSNLSHSFDRIVNYQDYLDAGTLRNSRALDYTAWSNNAVIYMGWAAEFAEDSEQQCRERMWAEGQFNTQDDTDKAHSAQKAALMMDFGASNYVIINADHGAPSSTVTWDASDLPYFHPAIFFGVSCSVGRIDVSNPKGTITYTAMERGVNAWLAPTRTAYGSWIQTYPYQPIAAPGLCYLYLVLMMNNDLTSGEAYQQAKNELIANGIGGDVDKVTTWQYQHYGDPGFNPYEPVNEGAIF